MHLKLTAFIHLTTRCTFALEGKVISIADGDTLTILTDENQQVKVRLSGIDTPEKNQAFGDKAKQALSHKVFGKAAEVKDHGQDQYRLGYTGHPVTDPL